jgi:hypothetical protein
MSAWDGFRRWGIRWSDWQRLVDFELFRGELERALKIGLALHEPVPDAKTIWLYRE